MKSISLKREPSEPYPVACTDSSPYPCAYFSFPDDRLSKLPQSGTVTFKYRVASRTESKKDGKDSCSVDLELQQILKIDGKEAEVVKTTSDAEDALDRIRDLVANDDKYPNDGVEA